MIRSRVQQPVKLDAVRQLPLHKRWHDLLRETSDPSCRPQDCDILAFPAEGVPDVVDTIEVALRILRIRSPKGDSSAPMQVWLSTSLENESG
jgi:hypothetical protein